MCLANDMKINHFDVLLDKETNKAYIGGEILKVSVLYILYMHTYLYCGDTSKKDKSSGRKKLSSWHGILDA